MQSTRVFTSCNCPRIPVQQVMTLTLCSYSAHVLLIFLFSRYKIQQLQRLPFLVQFAIVAFCSLIFASLQFRFSLLLIQPFHFYLLQNSISRFLFAYFSIVDPGKGPIPKKFPNKNSDENSRPKPKINLKILAGINHANRLMHRQ